MSIHLYHCLFTFATINFAAYLVCLNILKIAKISQVRQRNVTHEYIYHTLEKTL